MEFVELHLVDLQKYNDNSYDIITNIKAKGKQKIMKKDLRTVKFKIYNDVFVLFIHCCFKVFV